MKPFLSPEVLLPWMGVDGSARYNCNLSIPCKGQAVCGKHRNVAHGLSFERYCSLFCKSRKKKQQKSKELRHSIDMKTGFCIT
ncbi:hypothetical protein STEG23_033406, partial [Scotinomys teguina]